MMDIYPRVLPLIMLYLITGTTMMFAVMKNISERAVILTAGLLLLFPIALGSGYGGNYISWIMPFLIVTMASTRSPELRRLLAMAAMCALATYFVEYSFMDYTGEWLLRTEGMRWLKREIVQINSGRWMTALRLPLFLCYICILILGSRALERELDYSSKNPERL